ncbi:MAG: prepilin-type N-terminal cleavage/methylation domain-containing protein [Elusimicrobiota bacterium]|nr:prepilin-type N-terminal cleavage/methylation domain-containing protein [Elusimicrobiota bacterium]
MRLFRSRSGVTLVELMVAAVILAVAILGLTATFGGVQRALQASKNKTLASNLAQEKMQILKQKNYYQVLVTTDPAYNTDYTPALAYDSGYFPPESLREGGVSYTRYTFVQVAQENSGALITLAPTTPDTGMKLVTVSVTWTQGGEKRRYSVTSLMSNPDTVMSNSIFSGMVRSSEPTPVAIEHALVNAADNLGWQDYTSASGAYSINVAPGIFTLMATAPGYFRSFYTVTAAANATQTQDFYLYKMSSGTVRGTAWYHPDLVISQVVAATYTVVGDGSEHTIEYVTLFNPTTAAINIGETGASASKQINLGYLDENSTFDVTDEQFNFTHVSSYVPPRSGYLIANATFFVVAGNWVSADAYYQPTIASCGGAFYCDVIRTTKAGGLELTRTPTGAEVDKVGWDDFDNGAETNEGTSLELAATDGLPDGGQVVRIASATNAPAAEGLQVYGGAYDSNDNADDFAVYPTILVAPLTTGATMPVIAGVPAFGAVISANDGLSSPATAYNNGADPPSAEFTLQHVATGTWTAIISKNGYGLENATVTIAASGSVYTFPSSTTMLSTTLTDGFISGEVTDIAGVAISPAITVSPGGAGADQLAATTGRGVYFLRVSSPGTVDVTANPGNLNADYLALTQSIVVDPGEIVSDVDFVLTQGGRITGFVTRDGTNALPGVAVAALDSNGFARDQQVSDASGRFTTVNVATGAYTLSPAIDSIETATPSSLAVTVTVGATVHGGTFTISGAMGRITGAVTAGGAPIATGVLIVASSATLSGTPPALTTISSATLTVDPYYMTSSYEDGTYSLDLRGGSYLLYGYYTTISPSGAVTITGTNLGAVTVTPGATLTGQDFAW